MKQFIKRFYANSCQDVVDGNFEYGIFEKYGQWSNGQFAYSRCEEVNDQIVPVDEGAFYQMKWDHMYIMVRA